MVAIPFVIGSLFKKCLTRVVSGIIASYVINHKKRKQRFFKCDLLLAQSVNMTKVAVFGNWWIPMPESLHYNYE